MTDDTNDRDAGGEPEESRSEQDRSIADQAEDLLASDRIQQVEDVEARLVSTDSGDTLGHEEVVTGLRRELSAQSQVIDLLSEQREPEGVNVAKVLDARAVDVGLLMAAAERRRTADIIGPAASAENRRGVRNQITLPTSTAFQMCLRSVLIRIGRVAITGSGIFLGIAFFASVRVTTLVLEASAEAPADVDQARQIWLIVMALLVSVVGITNSMLMAVAERFREIGTMKCLGALDSFIVKLFLIESGMLGVLAGFFGAIVGGGLMLIVNNLRYTFAFRDIVGGLVATFLWSLVLGASLSVIAAILPAKQAAKMPAAAALRTDV